MEEVLDVMRRSIELAELGREALEHIQVQLNKGYLEQSISLFSDVLSGLIEIEKSTLMFAEQLPENQLAERFDLLRIALATAASAYESGNREEISRHVAHIVPDYRKWEAELQRCCHPFILS